MPTSIYSSITNYPAPYPEKPAHEQMNLDGEPATDELYNGSATSQYLLMRRQFSEDSLNRPFGRAPSQDDTMSHSTQRQQFAYPHSYAYDDPPKQLPALQVNGQADSDVSNLDPMTADDPASYELVAPSEGEGGEGYSLEKRSQTLFSREHLQVIFADPNILLKFTSFLGLHRPQSVPLLVYYLDALKALRALHYANAILEGLDPIASLPFTSQSVLQTSNPALEARANAAFDHLVEEELPAFITHQYIRVVSASISARITGALSPHLREQSEGLAEVFCLTDPGRPDNPIVFASEEFNRTMQYGMSYILGRNCRFLQGPGTNASSVRRLRECMEAGRQCQEVFLNYRRDGSPFMNLLMTAPLCDSRGIIRYFIGAQVDVSGLVKECAELESLQRLLELQAKGEEAPSLHKPDASKMDELRELAEMLNQAELSTVRRWGGHMHHEVQAEDSESHREGQSRLLITDPNTMTPPLGAGLSSSGKLSGVYQNYLLVRPHPSLRILFASPSQRVPGILQSPFLNKIGGSQRVRDELTAAFAEGRGVTAKVRWVNGKGYHGATSGFGGEDGERSKGRNKWIHCTPLLGAKGKAGCWMVVIVDDERDKEERGWRNGANGRVAPPVASSATSSERDKDRRRNGVFMGTDGRHMPGPDIGAERSNDYVNGNGYGNGYAYGHDGKPYDGNDSLQQHDQPQRPSAQESDDYEGSVGTRSMTSLRID